MFHSFVVLTVASFVAGISAQTCQTPAGAGPCIGGVCPANFQCLTNLANPICCASNQVVPAASTCQDQLTGTFNCQTVKPYCIYAQYCDLLKTLCPVTCGVCTPGATNNAAGIAAASTVCADKLTDCTKNLALCSNPVYSQLMTQQCAKTCGKC